jgi:hypothetical protein
MKTINFLFNDNDDYSYIEQNNSNILLHLYMICKTNEELNKVENSEFNKKIELHFQNLIDEKNIEEEKLEYEERKKYKNI